MAASKIESPGKESKFTTMLLAVARGMTSENLASVKLYLLSRKLVNHDAVDEMQYGSDALRVLLRFHYIEERDCDLLVQMLKAVGRDDLSVLVQKHMLIYQDVESNSKEEETVNHEECSNGGGKMFVDDESQPMSSQESSVSMTDEEKLHIKCLDLECDSQDLFN